MKVAIIEDYGATSYVVKVAENTTPELSADNVLIEAHAAGVNPIDNII
jgi:NADPH:quinone reductase-like Zn-dependent oxidoreductase